MIASRHQWPPRAWTGCAAAAWALAFAGHVVRNDAPDPTEPGTALEPDRRSLDGPPASAAPVTRDARPVREAAMHGAAGFVHAESRNGG